MPTLPTWQTGLACALLATLCGSAAAAPALTATELTWLAAAVPVLQFAYAQTMPRDSVQHPPPLPGAGRAVPARH